MTKCIFGPPTRITTSFGIIFKRFASYEDRQVAIKTFLGRKQLSAIKVAMVYELTNIFLMAVTTREH